MISILDKIRFRLIRWHSLKNIRESVLFDKSAIYLTFDDGPEEGITEFILDELRKHNVKATFFCCGKNCDKYPQLLTLIQKDGHTIANHTYSHINGYTTSISSYLVDVEHCESHLRTHLFRPPWGALTLKLYNKLRKNYRIILWDVVSGDTEQDNFNLEMNYERLKKNTKPGSVVLFHFCKKHERETKQILPRYLNFLSEGRIKTSVIK